MQFGGFAAAEIGRSKADLEQLVGVPILDFAYPYGGVNAAVATQVLAAGFRDAVSTRIGDVERLSAVPAAPGPHRWLRHGGVVRTQVSALRRPRPVPASMR